MKSLMIDIETLATNDSAAVVAIGSVIFNGDDIIDTQLILIDPVWAVGHRDQRTCEEFWMNREIVPHKVFTEMLGGGIKPWDACVELMEFIYPHNIKAAFAYPPQFDFTILRSMFRQCNREYDYPVHYSLERDCRTLFKLAKARGVDLGSAYEGIEKHNALSDAIAQTKAVQICNRELF